MFSLAKMPGCTLRLQDRGACHVGLCALVCSRAASAPHGDPLERALRSNLTEGDAGSGWGSRATVTIWLESEGCAATHMRSHTSQTRFPVEGRDFACQEEMPCFRCRAPIDAFVSRVRRQEAILAPHVLHPQGTAFAWRLMCRQRPSQSAHVPPVEWPEAEGRRKEPLQDVEGESRCFLEEGNTSCLRNGFLSCTEQP